MASGHHGNSVLLIFFFFFCSETSHDVVLLSNECFCHFHGFKNFIFMQLYNFFFRRRKCNV